MDSLLFSAPFSKGAFGVFWTGFVDSVRTGVSFVAKLWCRLRYVLFTPEFLVDKSPKMWHNTRRGCALRAVQYIAPPSYFACVAQLVEQLTRNEQVAGSSPATSSIKAKQYRCRRPEAYGINCSRAFSPRKFTDDSIDANHCFPLTGGTRTPICSEVGKIKTMWCPF